MPGHKIPEDVRREQLLHAALQVALQGGLGAVTARGVAEAAGASPGLVFFHFGSKQGLLDTLLDALLDGAFDAEVTPQIAALPSGHERLRVLLAGELEGVDEQRSAAELLLSFWLLYRAGDARERILARVDAYTEVFLPVCADALLEVDPAGGASARGLADTCVSLVLGTALQSLRGPFDAGPYLAVLESVLGSVRTRPRPPR